MSEQSYPCPCCGHLVFDEPPGSLDICLVCFWEDDRDQLRSPSLAGGANAVSLLEAQRNFAKFGAIEQRFASDVSPPTENQPLDPTFRPIAVTDDFGAPDESAPWPDDSTTLYYFRPNFWRSVVS